MPAPPSAAVMIVAVIWLSGTITMLCGCFIGVLIVRISVRIVRDIHTPARSRMPFVPHHRGVEYDQLGTVDAERAHAKVINLDRYRKRTQRPQDRRSDAPDRSDDDHV